MSTSVYKTACEIWQPNNFLSGITNKDFYDLIKHDVNSDRDTLVILTVKKTPIQWLRGEEFQSLEMELFVVFWDRDQKLQQTHDNDKAWI